MEKGTCMFHKSLNGDKKMNIEFEQFNGKPIIDYNLMLGLFIN